MRCWVVTVDALTAGEFERGRGNGQGGSLPAESI